MGWKRQILPTKPAGLAAGLQSGWRCSKQSMTKSRTKLAAQPADESEDRNGAAFKQYDNKFFDMDCVAEGPKPCTISVSEIQELQQYVTNCYDALYKDLNAFKSSVTNQLLSLQEEVQTLSFYSTGRNSSFYSEAVKESQSQNGIENIDGRTDKSCQWPSKARVPDDEVYEKTSQRHHEMRPHHPSESRGPAPTDGPSPRKQLIKRPSHQTEDRTQCRPALTWSDLSTKLPESSRLGAFNQSDGQPTERKQEITHLSRHLQGPRSPNSTQEHKKSTNWGSKIRPGWSPKQSHELFPTCTTTDWQDEDDGESKLYPDVEEAIELANETVVSTYGNHPSNGLRAKGKSFSDEHVKGGAGRDRFTLHGWAAAFLQQPTGVQSPRGKAEDTICVTPAFKSVNEEHELQGVHKLKDKARVSKLLPPEDTQSAKLRTEQPLAKTEMISKSPRFTLAKGSFTLSNSEDSQLARNLKYMSHSSSRLASIDNENGELNDLKLEKLENKFLGKKCRGGIAWTVDELVEQNEQRAMM